MPNPRTPRIGVQYRIQGVGEWLQLPDLVSAPSPEDRSVTCLYNLAVEDTLSLARAGRREPIFECWSMVLGAPPPVPGCAHRNRGVAGELTKLADAHALFHGIERPLADDDDGARVLAYVTKPHFFYEYDPNMVSVAKKSAVPHDLVFVIYVRLGIESASGKSGMARGTVTHWHFVEADADHQDLPVNYATRFRARRW
jgi:hypothetical protein